MINDVPAKLDEVEYKLKPLINSYYIFGFFDWLIYSSC